MPESSGSFAGLLRELRLAARLTQEELADAAGLSLRAVSDLERGVVATPQRETVRLLADALRLIGPDRARFEALARGRPVTGSAAATRTLPRDIASFTGREQELAQLVGAAAGAGGGAVVGIHAIGGMAGVGKTAFTVHAAHRLADRFPDGQVFLPLHGHTPGRQPVEPADALASLLLTVGVPAAQIPPGRQARTMLWRDRAADLHLLLVLDDAASSEQVEPLLPSGASLVLVTSRRHLSALEAAVISLDVLWPDEAAGMLVRLAGRPGLGQGDPGVREIVRLCGFLPLAIGMMGRQLHHHLAWSASGRAAELGAARDRLELMTTENVSVAAAFDLSYEDLTPGQRVLFRRLGLHPGADIDHYAAAALGGVDPPAARRGLEDLYDQYLLTEPAPGRYRMHDLIREHARASAAREDPGQDRDQAAGRLLDYYQYAAARANVFIARQARPAPGGAVPPAVPAVDNLEQALAWGRAERPNLLACLDHAAEAGQHARVVALTAGLSGLLQNDGPWADAIARHTAAIAAARQLGDQPAQAAALNDLGAVRQLTGEYPAATRDLEEALGICRDLGDRPGEADALINLGVVRRLRGDFPAAVRDLEKALGICRDLGDRSGTARTLIRLGNLRQLTGDFPAAVRDLQEAFGICRDLGDRPSEADALNQLGSARHETGDYPAAILDFEEALGIYREIGGRLGEANALWYLGVTRRKTGDYPAALRALADALGIYREIGGRLGEANALSHLGATRRQGGDFPAAVRDLQEALDLYHGLGDRLGEAMALSHLGAVWRQTGDFPAAEQALDQALSIFRDLGEHSGEAEALNESGTLYRVSGDLTRSQGCHQQALELAREVGIAVEEAQALAGLGRRAVAAGDPTRAASLLGQAQEIFLRIGAAGAAQEVAAELETLNTP